MVTYMTKISSYVCVCSQKPFNSSFHLNMAKYHIANAQRTVVRQGKKQFQTWLKPFNLVPFKQNLDT